MNKHPDTPGGGRLNNSVGGLARKAAAATTIVVTTLVGLVCLASPAGAHHPEGELLRVECRGADHALTPLTDSDQVLEAAYSVTPWFQQGGSQASFANANITIEVRVNGGAWTPINRYLVDEASISPAVGAVAGDEVIYTSEGIFQPLQDHLVFPLLASTGTTRGHTQGGSFLIESDSIVTSVEARVRANAPWGNGSGGGQTSSIGTIQVAPTDCSPSVIEPIASSTWECGSDITVTLDNTASNESVDFVVDGGDPVTVPAGESTVVSLGGPIEDGAAVPVTVTVGGETIHTVSHGPATCTDPVASSTWECGSEITVTLDNTASDLPVEFVVDGGAPVVVPAGEIVELTFDAPAEDGAPKVVTVTVGGETIHSGSYRADCTDPVASSTWECGSDITVILDNTASDLPVEFVVDGGAPVVVPAGEIVELTFDAPAEDGAPSVVTVTVGGETVHSGSYEADCVDDEVEPRCEDDEEAVDSDDDGTPDTCAPICEDGTDPSDADGDGTADECPEVLPSTTGNPTVTPTVSPTVTPTAQPTTTATLALTGSSTAALALAAMALVLIGSGLTLAGKERSEA